MFLRWTPAVALVSLALASDAIAPSPRTRTPNGRQWWLQKRSTPAVPSLPAADRAWVKNPVDAFILAKLRKEGLRPSPPADRRTLLRRVYVRPDRPAADARRDGRVRRRPVARRLSRGRRPAARQPALRRALGPALARRRPLRRDRRLRVRHAIAATPGGIAITSSARSTTTSRSTASCSEQLAGDEIAPDRTTRR